MRFDVWTFVVGLAVSLLTGQLVGTASADVVDNPVQDPVHYALWATPELSGPRGCPMPAETVVDDPTRRIRP